MNVMESIRAHAIQVSEDARQLADALAEAAEDSMPPLVQAVALVDLERVRADLARAAEALLMHAAPKAG